jgi:hypothetical protein
MNTKKSVLKTLCGFVSLCEMFFYKDPSLHVVSNPPRVL